MASSCGRRPREGRGGGAKTQGLAQDELVAHLRSLLSDNSRRVNKAKCNQAVFGFLILDSVSTSNDDTSLASFFRAAAKNFAGDISG